MLLTKPKTVTTFFRILLFTPFFWEISEIIEKRNWITHVHNWSSVYWGACLIYTPGDKQHRWHRKMFLFPAEARMYTCSKSEAYLRNIKPIAPCRCNGMTIFSKVFPWDKMAFYLASHIDLYGLKLRLWFLDEKQWIKHWEHNFKSFTDYNWWLNSCWVIFSNICFFQNIKKNHCFHPFFLLIYNLNVKQFGSQMKPHILWAFIWIQIVCKGHQRSSKFTASGLRVKPQHKQTKSYQCTCIWRVLQLVAAVIFIWTEIKA